MIVKFFCPGECMPERKCRVSGDEADHEPAASGSSLHFTARRITGESGTVSINPSPPCLDKIFLDA
jgi:hypothetical protein